MKGRKSKIMALLLTTSVVLAACGNAGTENSNGNDAASGQTAETAQNTTKTASSDASDLVWWGWTPGSPLNEQYIAKFNESYPDISITWKQTTVDDYDAAIKPALANGEGVDIFEVSAGSANGGVQIFGSKAVDLTDALKGYLGDDYADKLNEASLSSMTVDGQIKALGVGTCYAGNLWINQDLFDQ